MNTVPLQLELSPELPNIYGALDYREFRETLIKIDEILRESGLEEELISEALERYVVNSRDGSQKSYSSKSIAFHYKKLRHALRCNIARHLTGESYRGFSVRLADSNLLQWFTNISAFSSRKAVSKSSLERYGKMYDEELINRKIHEWLAKLSNIEQAQESGLYRALDCSEIFLDSTCVKANIHFPVDWVLLRDAVRSLLSAIKTIRNQGLKHRMIEPHLFLRQMNKMCIAMTHTRRRVGGKKQRKVIFRAMKKLSNCIAKHGERYRKLLDNEWEKTEWTRVQAEQVLGRIDLVLKKLPKAIKQAHERIIGERQVASQDKMLSLYDEDAHVIVRGKAGNEVEFGQSLLITEQREGIIIDWQLFKNKAPADSKLLKPTIIELEKNYGDIISASTDRSFNSKENNDFLTAHNIYNATCPRSPDQLQKKLTEPIFLSLQTRRSQTEARIGIFKNVFLGRPLRSRITAYKRLAINWCVLTHNLWVLSRQALSDEQSIKQAA